MRPFVTLLGAGTTLLLAAPAAQLHNLPGGERMEALLCSIHMTAAEAGALAAQAHVDTLVLSHLTPGDDPTVTDEQWIAEASAHFNGRIMVGRDLLEL